jgi:hypothetical protein
VHFTSTLPEDHRLVADQIVTWHPSILPSFVALGNKLQHTYVDIAVAIFHS